jgi:hypothetical protein
MAVAAGKAVKDNKTTALMSPDDGFDAMLLRRAPATSCLPVWDSVGGTRYPGRRRVPWPAASRYDPRVDPPRNGPSTERSDGMAYDLLIRNGVSSTVLAAGLPRRRRCGQRKIVEVGGIGGSACQVIAPTAAPSRPASSTTIATTTPGPRDPLCTPCDHGSTTVTSHRSLALAPVKPDAREKRRDVSPTSSHPDGTLKAGVPWTGDVP